MLDIRGSKKNTKINKNPYVVIDELLSNAIDSYLIRKHSDKNISALNVVFDINIFDRDVFGTQYNYSISCTDNGSGFGDDQTKAFLTKDTSYKDDLAISGIGKCRGSGRIQFLHYFSNVKVDSVFECVDGKRRRILSIDGSIKEVGDESFTVSDAENAKVETTISLDSIHEEIYEKVFVGKNVKEIFSSDSVRSHILEAFIHRLVGLKDDIGDFFIEFNENYKDKSNSSQLVMQDLPEVSDSKSVTVFYKDPSGVVTDKKEDFKIIHYKLDKSKYKMRKNIVALCAKSSSVKDITKKYLKTNSIANNDVEGFYHIVLVDSDYFDKHVNESRDDFNLPESSHQADTFLGSLISLEEIYEEIDDVINDYLTPPDWDKSEIVANVGSKYGVSPSMVVESGIRIRYGDTEESVVKRVLNSYQDKIIKDTSEIFEIKENISKAVPYSDDFRQKINDLAWKYTASLKSIDMAHLSQLVVRRAAILEVLQMAINKNLDIQNVPKGERRRDEEIIHSIFFPMRKDSNEVEDHDIWVLNEEYQYYDYIASDKKLSTIKWTDDQMLFESDIDEELEKILANNYLDNKEKRPDIAIFSKEGSVIIVEFKSPGVNLQEHVNDLMEYSVLLASKSNGKLRKFYGYLIGDTVNKNRIKGFNKFANGKGWFSTDNVMEHDSETKLGELYSEILFYSDVVDRAKLRLDVYKKRLKFEIN